MEIDTTLLWFRTNVKAKFVLEQAPLNRTPVDFLATPKVWSALVDHFGIERTPLTDTDPFDPAWEAVLRRLNVDCRVLSYDSFFAPPASALCPGARIDWWSALSRSTPSRMWRQLLPDGSSRDLWGHGIEVVAHPTGAYEEFSRPSLAAASLDDLKLHA